MIKLRPYQTEAVQSIFDYYASGKTGNPVIAMPTGTGKSLVIGDFVHSVLQRWPRQRILMATHVKELIEQNAEKMRMLWPEAPLGIYSAGLDRREYQFPIVFGGVASMVNRIEQFGWRDLLVVDEAHLISGKDNSNYGKLIAGLKKTNPNLKVIGLSATPWRLGQGLITEGGVFTDICFDITSMQAFNRLIAEGYLCLLIPKRTKTELETSDVKIQAGDYVQKDLQAAVDKASVTYAACREIVEQGADRRSWLVFAAGIEHSNHIAACLQTFGIEAYSVHSKISDDERNQVISRFKNGTIRCVVNNNVLTTGFDHPAMDLIAMLRPTVSTGLWVQMLGRGTRPSPDTQKENCLVLDFAGNTKRLGPINDPVIPKKRKPGELGVAPVRICEACGTYNHARATECICCGAKFEHAPKIQNEASTDDLIRQEATPVIEHYDVQRAIYNRHQKLGSQPMIKVSYFCGLKMFNEWICPEHSGYARKKFTDWWMQRIGSEAPKTTDEALLQVGQLRVPRQVRVWVNKKYPEVLSVVF